MKVNITIPDDLLTRIDEYADENYMSRSGFLANSATQVLNSNDLVKAIQTMSFAIAKIAETGEIDEETLKQLEDFQRFANLIGLKK